MFTSNSLSGNQSNASLTSSSTGISSATSVEVSSKETGSSSSLQIVTTRTQNVSETPSGAINGTGTIFSNSVTMLSSLAQNSYTATPSSANLSSLYSVRSNITGSFHSTPLALSATDSLSIQDQSNTLPSSSATIGLPNSFQSRSKETNASISLQVVTTAMQSVSTASSATRSSYVFQSNGSGSLFSTPLPFSASNSLSSRNQSNALLSSSTAISSPDSFQSSSKEANSSSSLEMVPTSMQTVFTAVGSSLGSIEVTETIHSSVVTMAGSLTHSSHTRTPSFVFYSSTYGHQSDSTETFRSTFQAMSNTTTRATSGSYSSFQLHTTNGTHVQTSQANLAPRNSSTISPVVATVHESSSFAPMSEQIYSRSVTPSIAISISSQFISDHHVTVVTVFPSSSTSVSNPPHELSSRTTLQLNQTINSTFGSIRLSETKQSSESMTSFNQLSATTTKGKTSTAGFTSQQTIAVETSYPSGVSTNTSVKQEGHSTTALSLVITTNYSKVVSNPLSQFISTTSATATLETSAKEVSLSQMETIVNTYVSLKGSTGIANSKQPLSTSKTSLLSNVSFSYNSSMMSSKTASVLLTKSVSRLATKASSASSSIPQETSGQSIITTESRHTMETADVVSSSLLSQSKGSSLISTRFTATASQFPNVSIAAPPSRASRIANTSALSSVYDLTSSSRTTAVLISPSSEQVNISSMSISYKTTFTTQGSTNVSTLLLQSRMESTSTKTTLNTGESTLLPNTTTVSYLSSTTTINSTEKVIVTASKPLTSNSTVVDKFTPSLKVSKLETTTSYISSTAGETNFTSSSPLRSIVMTFSKTSFNVSGASITESFNGSESLHSSSNVPLSTSTFLSSINSLQSTSNFMGPSTSEITSSTRDNTTTTVSSPLLSVFSINSSNLVSYTSHNVTESSVLPLQNRTVSFSKPYSSEDSNASTLQQKASTSLTSTASIFRTSFSAKKITSDSQPTLTLSLVTMAASKSDSAASHLISTNVSRTFTIPRNTTAAEAYFTISSSSFVKRDSSQSILTTTSASAPKQTHVFSTHQVVSLSTLAETASRTTNRSVSVHKSSSYMHEKSSKFNKDRTK